MKLDHVVVAVNNLDEAMRDYQSLGFTVVKGGVHANRATENALIVFSDGTYIELLARTGEAPVPGLVDFSQMLDDSEGLKGFALGTDDIDADIERLRAKSFNIGDVISGERRRQDGTLIQWKLALIDDGFSPFLIQDVTPRELRVPTDPAITTHRNGMLSVQRVSAVLNESSWADYLWLVDEQIARLTQN